MNVGMLTLLAGMGQGYERGLDRQRENARRDWMQGLQTRAADREQTLFDQAQDERRQLADAAAPVVATPELDGAGAPRMLMAPGQDARDIGQPGEPGAVASMTVLGRGGQTPDQARRTAWMASAPEAVMQRQIAVLQRTDPAKAAAMAASVTRQKAATVDLANKEFDDGLNAAAGQGWGALIDFTNTSGASPAQHRWVPSADGKTGQVSTVLPDGSIKPTGMVFSNDAKGAMEAATMLSRTTPVTAKLAHYQSQQRLDAVDADRRADNARQDARDAEIGRHNRAMEGYTGMRALGSAMGSGRKADHFDEKQWDDANKIETSFVTFADPSGGTKGIESPELRQRYRQKLNQLRATGDYAPNEAAEMARDAVLQLKSAAEQRAADSRKAAADGGGWFSKAPEAISESDAVRQILREAQTSEKTTRATASPLPAGPKTELGRQMASAPPGGGSLINGQWVPSGSASTTPGAPPALPSVVNQAGATLDAARAAASAARDRLRSFGSMQRAADPKGFAAAQAALSATAEARDRAEQDYRAAVAAGSATSAAFGRYAAP